MFDQFKVYIIGGAALAASVFVGSLLWQIHSISSELSASEAGRIAATGQRDEAIKANEANTAALIVMANNEAVNNKLLTDLSADLEKVRVDMTKIAADRQKLAQDNPDVKAFLNTPVPAAMRMRKTGN